MTEPLPRRASLAAVALLMVLLGSLSCGSTRYLLGAARGQLGHLAARRALGAAMADPATPEDVRALIVRCRRIRRFAVQELGLKDTGSYHHLVDTGGGPAAWNLSACPPDALRPLTWWFPVVGRVPYLGFFDRRAAERAARRLRDQGQDIQLYGAAAYSTLGWFRDPIFSTWSAFSEAELAELICHEMTHGTIFVASAVDYDESLGTFVGQEGARRYLAREHGPEIMDAPGGAMDAPGGAMDAPGGAEELRDYEAHLADGQLFDAFIEEFCGEIEKLYQRGLALPALLPLKEAAFAAARERYARDLRPRLQTSDFDWFRQLEANNAKLLSLRRYQSGQPLFQRLHHALGDDLVRTLDYLKKHEPQGDPWGWLKAEAEGLEAGR